MRVALINDTYQTREVGELISDPRYSPYTIVRDDGTRYRTEGRIEREAN